MNVVFDTTFWRYAHYIVFNCVVLYYIGVYLIGWYWIVCDLIVGDWVVFVLIERN